MAFDAATGKMVLFGGYVERNGAFDAQALSDTWTWDGTRWTLVNTTSRPLGRSGAPMVYDSVRRVAVLRGGTTQSGGFINDTWTWNGARWIQMSPQQTPSTPSEFALTEPMSWDAGHQYTLALIFPQKPFGGPGELGVTQTWAWDGTNWSQLTTRDAPPGMTNPPGLAYDSARNLTVFFGQLNGAPVTWTFDGTAWSQAASTSGTASTTFSIAPDDAHSDVVLFGENGDTWTWNGTKWTAQNPIHSPPARRNAAMAYDQAHHAVVLFGGVKGNGGAAELNDTWTWNGTDWTEVG